MSVPEIKLVFDEPVQRKKAPKHLADYSPEERRELAKSLGLPAFRANQVATHYFTHLSNDPENWTDIPAEMRQTIAEQFTPKLIELVRSVECDGGMTRKERVCCLLVLNLVSSTLPCIRRPGPRLI